MKLLAFSVFDKKVGAFAQPFFCRSEGEAIRSFTDACQEGSHVFCKHPEDYLLFKVGLFDDAAGHMSMESTGPKPIIEAFQCVKVVDN